jgi:hypothetical protein
MDGATLAPVDLLSVDATVFVRPEGLEIEATARFLSGDDATALSVLELQPLPVEALLDGDLVTLDAFTVSDPARDLVSVGAHPACTEHTLTVRYTLPPDWQLEDDAPVRFEPSPEGVFWAAGLADNIPGRFLSIWMPSNLLFDRFDLSMAVDASALDTPHELSTTGEVVEIPGGWQVAWAGIQAHTPFWVLSPTSITEHRSVVVPLSEGDITVEVRSLLTDEGADPDEALERAAAALADFSALFGPYNHGDRYELWIREDVRSSMEYDGATLTQMHNIEHEVLHSWIGRGVAPVADLHGWVDEAFTSWATDGNTFRVAAMDLSSEPRPLESGDTEWAGATIGPANYVYGSALPAHLAERHGVDALIDALGAFYLEHLDTPYRADDLEEHLTCWWDDDGVREAFLHTGYGIEGPPAPRPDDWCL